MPEGALVIEQEPTRTIRPSTVSEWKSRINSIDSFRFLASYGIVLGHTNPFFATITEDTAPFLLKAVAYLMCHLLRLALPFFLMTSGYLFTRSVLGGKPVMARYAGAFNRLGSIFLFWSVVYTLFALNYNVIIKDIPVYGVLKSVYWQLIKQINHPVVFILGGTKYHLWFLPALLISLFVVAVCIRMNKEKFLPYMAFISYLAMFYFYPTGKETVFFGIKHMTLYGVCKAFVYVSCGSWLAKGMLYSKKVAVHLLITAVCVQIIQNIFSWQLYRLNHLSIVHVGLLPASLAVFILGLHHPAFGSRINIHKLSIFTFGVYCVHPLILEFIRTFEGFLDKRAWDLLFAVAVYGLSLALIVILKKIKYVKSVVS